MIASERYAKIVEIVNERSFISTNELAEIMNVTKTTIRKDCEELEARGLLIKVHGGAKSVKQNEIISSGDELSIRERNINNEEKDIVCKKAASFVHDGDCIFLDGGTSIVPMLKYLKGKKIIIVTHSQLIVDAFNDDEAELYIIGGRYIPGYGMSVGPDAIKALERFNFDYTFLGCSGVDLNRRIVYTVEMDTMAIKQKAMDLSFKNYLLIDTSKCFIKGFCSFTKSDNFDAIICNYNKEIDNDELPNNYILVE